MPEVSGNLIGIKDSVIARINAIYDLSTEPGEFLSREMAYVLADITSLIRREIAVYLGRNGEVIEVSVGQSDNVKLADFGQRRSIRRLSCVRCIHTHPNGSPVLSDVDMAALVSLRLDAICALGVDSEGHLTGAGVAFLAPDEEGNLKASDIILRPVFALTDPVLMDTIAQNDLITTNEEYITKQVVQKAFLISVDSDNSLEELKNLAESAGARVVGSLLQSKTKPDKITYIGSGKAAEAALQAQAAEADLVIIDDELTGSQTHRLEEILGLPVVDRTTLILDIFAQRASSSEGKLQVSLAQLNYQSSRLVGSRISLSRLAGGIGTRGPGESKLEMDRRVIRRRIQLLKDELKELERQRSIRRKNRLQSDIPNVALVGYTNTGKSTLLNLLSGANAYVQDQLFATLDTISRKVTLPEGDELLLTDSVGFISKLPTDLVEAFQSTLDEALGADILMIVSDASNPDTAHQRKVVEEVLHTLGAEDQPRIEVYNKWDIADPEKTQIPPGALKVSAKTGEGIEDLLKTIAQVLREREQVFQLFVPFQQYQALGELRKLGRIVEETHQDNGTRVMVRLKAAAAQRFHAQNPYLFERPGI